MSIVKVMNVKTPCNLYKRLAFEANNVYKMNPKMSTNIIISTTHAIVYSTEFLREYAVEICANASDQIGMSLSVHDRNFYELAAEVVSGVLSDIEAVALFTK